MKSIVRITEFIIGVLLAIFLIASYSDEHGRRYFIDYIIPQQPYKTVVVIIVILVASRLIAGTRKDYSRFFYKALVRIFGEPGKKQVK